MTTFSPQTFLTNQGWEGPGSGLRKGSIKKPVTVAHKTNLKGIGKERDTGYAWWDDVFSMVANKKKGSDVAIRKTSTGIHSPLPPGSLSAISSAPDSGSVTPIASTSSHFHTDIIGQAKLEATRREFYAKFLRGRSLEGSVQEAEETTIVEQVASIAETDSEQDEVQAREQKRKEKEVRRLEKQERRRLKKEKKGKKEKRKAQDVIIEKSDAPADGHSASSHASSGAAESSEQGSHKQKKRKRSETEEDAQNNAPAAAEVNIVASKAERKAQRARKRQEKALRKLKDTVTVEGTVTAIDSSGHDAASKSDATTSADAKAAKKARKEERKRRKVEKAEV